MFPHVIGGLLCITVISATAKGAQWWIMSVYVLVVGAGAATAIWRDQQ